MTSSPTTAPLYTGPAASRIRSTATKAEIADYEARGIIAPLAPVKTVTADEARINLIKNGMAFLLDTPPTADELAAAGK